MFSPCSGAAHAEKNTIYTAKKKLLDSANIQVPLLLSMHGTGVSASSQADSYKVTYLQFCLRKPKQPSR